MYGRDFVFKSLLFIIMECYVLCSKVKYFIYSLWEYIDIFFQRYPFLAVLRNHGGEREKKKNQCRENKQRINTFHTIIRICDAESSGKKTALLAHVPRSADRLRCHGNRSITNMTSVFLRRSVCRSQVMGFRCG